jgi:hypothetical protein
VSNNRDRAMFCDTLLWGHEIGRVGCQKIQRQLIHLGTTYLCQRPIDLTFIRVM